MSKCSVAGDTDCHDILGPFVPKLVKMLGDETEPWSLHIQCVRTLSEMVHFDRFIIDKVSQRPSMSAPANRDTLNM